jgi:hypothetical protein
MDKGRIVPDGGRDRKHGRQDDTRFAYFGWQACGSYSERPGKRQLTEFGTGKGGREIQ